MTEIDAGVTNSDPHPHDDGLLRRSAQAHRDVAVRLTTGHSLDEGLSYALERMIEAIGGTRAFLATWNQHAHVGRALVGAPHRERQAFFQRPLPPLPDASVCDGDVTRVTAVGDLRSTHPWLADICDDDDVVLAVGAWAGRHPTCLIGIAGLPTLDDDRRLVIEGFLMMLMGTTIGEMLRRQRDRSELRRSEALDTLVDQLDSERRRISHEIHDGVLQSVSSIAHFLETLSATSESDETRAVLERLRLEAQNSAITLRRIVNDFEPEQRNEESTTVRVRALTSRVSDLFGLKVDLEVGPGVDDAGLAEPILRVLRQALDNIITHADATTVRVRATLGPDDDLTLTVDDDGKGIENDQPWDLGVGLRSMTRIVNDHGGVLNLDRPPSGTGTRLVATFATDTRMPTLPTGADASPGDGDELDSDLLDRVRLATLSMLERDGRPTISSVAATTGLTRRDLITRFASADSMIADAVAFLVDSIEDRWAAFEPIDPTDPLEARLDALVERRFEMEVWGRPLSQHTALVDPSARFDAEVLAAFHPELSALPPAERSNTGHLVAWLLRTRSIRAILSGVTVHPHVAQTTIRSVAASLLRREQRSD